MESLAQLCIRKILVSSEILSIILNDGSFNSNFWISEDNKSFIRSLSLKYNSIVKLILSDQIKEVATFTSSHIEIYSGDEGSIIANTRHRDNYTYHKFNSEGKKVRELKNYRFLGERIKYTLMNNISRVYYPNYMKGKTFEVGNFLINVKNCTIIIYHIPTFCELLDFFENRITVSQSLLIGKIENLKRKGILLSEKEKIIFNSLPKEVIDYMSKYIIPSMYCVRYIKSLFIQ